jgi:hypothetical protein
MKLTFKETFGNPRVARTTRAVAAAVLLTGQGSHAVTWSSVVSAANAACASASGTGYCTCMASSMLNAIKNAFNPGGFISASTYITWVNWNQEALNNCISAALYGGVPVSDAIWWGYGI